MRATLRGGALCVGVLASFVAARPLPGFSASEIVIASEDGRELYVFDQRGRHLRTVEATTGAALLTFGYGPTGLLASVTDADGNITSIERDGAGRPSAIVAPRGQRTILAHDGQGYLATVTNPALGSQTDSSAIRPGVRGAAAHPRPSPRNLDDRQAHSAYP